MKGDSNAGNERQGKLSGSGKPSGTMTDAWLLSQSALRRKETVAFAAARMDSEDIVPVTKEQTLCHLYKRRHLADSGARGCGRGWERVSNRGSFHSAK